VNVMDECKLTLIEEVDMGFEKRYRFRAEKNGVSVIINIGATSLEEAAGRARAMAFKYLRC